MRHQDAPAPAWAGEARRDLLAVLMSVRAEARALGDA